VAGHKETTSVNPPGFALIGGPYNFTSLWTRCRMRVYSFGRGIRGGAASVAPERISHAAPAPARPANLSSGVSWARRLHHHESPRSCLAAVRGTGLQNHRACVFNYTRVGGGSLLAGQTSHGLPDANAGVLTQGWGFGCDLIPSQTSISSWFSYALLCSPSAGYLNRPCVHVCILRFASRRRETVIKAPEDVSHSDQDKSGDQDGGLGSLGNPTSIQLQLEVGGLTL
jgi:hypothetical protein